MQLLWSKDTHDRQTDRQTEGQFTRLLKLEIISFQPKATTALTQYLQSNSDVLL